MGRIDWARVSWAPALPPSPGELARLPAGSALRRDDAGGAQLWLRLGAAWLGARGSDVDAARAALDAAVDAVALAADADAADAVAVDAAGDARAGDAAVAAAFAGADELEAALVPLPSRGSDPQIVPAQLERVSRQLLGGRRVPRALAALWAGHLDGGGLYAPGELVLLDEPAQHEVPARLRAELLVFARRGRGWLGLWARDASLETAPVVARDGEALVAVAADLCDWLACDGAPGHADAGRRLFDVVAQAWLRRRGLPARFAGDVRARAAGVACAFAERIAEDRAPLVQPAADDAGSSRRVSSPRRFTVARSLGGPIVAIAAELAGAWRGCDGDLASDFASDFDRARAAVAAGVPLPGVGALAAGAGRALVFAGDAVAWVASDDGGVLMRAAPGDDTRALAAGAAWHAQPLQLGLDDGRLYVFDAAFAGARDAAAIRAGGVLVAAPGPGRYAVDCAVAGGRACVRLRRITAA